MNIVKNLYRFIGEIQKTEGIKRKTKIIKPLYPLNL